MTDAKIVPLDTLVDSLFLQEFNEILNIGMNQFDGFFICLQENL